MEDNSPEAWRSKARGLFDAGDSKAAAALQRRMLAALERDGQRYLRDYLYQAMYLAASQRVQAAAQVLEKIPELGARDFAYHLNLGTLYYRLKRLPDAKRELLRARALKRGNAQVMTQLTRVLACLGERRDAGSCGEIALLNQAREVAKLKSYTIPARSPAPIDLSRPRQNIIACALPDFARNTVTAALRNAVCASVLYPGWTCRFYTRPGLPQPVARELARHGAQVAMVSQSGGRFRAPEFWPLHVLNDQHVRYFLVRDVRNLLSLRERDAVQAWLGSGKWFHLMRDHYAHTYLIVSGLWGGATGVLPSVHKLMAGFRDPLASSGSRMHVFLQYCVWPTLRRSCLAHDSQFHVLKSKDFPTMPRDPEKDFVGNPVAARRRLPPVSVPDYELQGQSGQGLITETERLLF